MFFMDIICIKSPLDMLDYPLRLLSGEVELKEGRKNPQYFMYFMYARRLVEDYFPDGLAFFPSEAQWC